MGLALTLALAGPAAAQDLPVPEPPAVPGVPAVPTLPIPAIPGVTLPELEPTGDPAADAAIASVRNIAETPSNVQSEVNAAIAQQQSLGLQRALMLAAQVGAPTCAQLGALAAATGGGLGLNVNSLTPLGGGNVLNRLTRIDSNTNKYLMDFYKQALTAPSTPLPEPLNSALPQVAGAQALLILLKLNWHTTYYPPNGGTPRAYDTPAYLDLPILLDVDGNLSFDLCAVMALDLGTGQITQQISKLPNASANLPVDVTGQYLNGVINSGYETQGSSAPSDFGTSLPLSPTKVVTNLKAPGPKFTQLYGLTSALQYRWASTKPALSWTYTSATPEGGSGTQINYTGSSVADRFAYSLKLATLNFGVAATPAPKSLEYCYSTKGSCSTAPAERAATQKVSLRMLASQPIKLDQTSGGTAAAGSECPSSSLLGNEVHMTGDRFAFAADPTSATGSIWLDVPATTAAACMATTPAVTGPLVKLPAGFSADKRLATWATPAGTSVARTTGKSGSVNCPAGTSAAATFGLVALTKYLCAFPPVNTVVPPVTGQPYLGAVLTAGNGTWTPATSDANAPAFSYQWQRCDAAGTACTAIAGATASTRTLTTEDMGRRIRALVTATNADGVTSAASVATGAITLPPAPVIVTKPTITGIPGIGKVLTALAGTWNNAPTAFAYQWRQCDSAGDGCSDIAGATGATYEVRPEDLDRVIDVVVTASNLGGTGTSTSAGLLVPPPPVNETLPVVKNGSVVATGRAILAGDHLTAVTGAWRHAASFGYQWQRCDATGGGCADIAGATGETYAADAATDIGSTLRAVVSAINPNGTVAAVTAATGAVIANDLAIKGPASVVDGRVLASTPSDHGTTFVGGTFDTVGPYVGGAARVAPGGGALSQGARAAGGGTQAILSDGAGGYYLGGTFTHVLGEACPSLAHVLADGTLDAPFCHTGLSGEVRALSLAHGLLAVGGLFTLGEHRNLAFLDAGANPTFVGEGDPNGAVNAIENDATNTLQISSSNTTVQNKDFFVGGDFTAVGSTPRKRLVGLVLNGGNIGIGGWTGGVDCSTCSGATVRAIEYVRGQSSATGAVISVLVGGRFDTAYSGSTGTTATAKNNAAAFGVTNNATSGVPSNSLGSWNPNPNGLVTALLTPNVQTGTNGVAPVYFAGEFSSLGAGTNVVPNSGAGLFSFVPFASLTFGRDPSAGKGATGLSAPSTVWTPQVAGGAVRALAMDATSVYLGGTFTSVYGATRHRVAAVGLAGTTPPALGAFDPNAGADVLALAADGGSLLVGGAFKVLGGQTRDHVAEIHPATGVTGWNPGTDGAVRAIATDGGTVYLGGTFAKAGGADRANLAAVGADGVLSGWNPGADGAVRALATAAGTVFAGGDFATAGGAARNHLAAIGADGAAAAWDPGTDGPVKALAVAGDTVHVGGAFGSAGGAPRANLAAIGADGAATSWNPGVDGEVLSLLAGDGSVYVGGAFGNAGGAARANLAAIGADGVATGWDPGTDGPVRSLGVRGPTLFAGGAFDHAGRDAETGEPALRHNVAGIADDGTATGFAPGPDGAVDTISLTSGGSLALGGGFTSLSSASAPGLAHFGG